MSFCNKYRYLIIFSVLTRHADEVWVANEEWITNTYICVPITCSSNTTNYSFTAFLATASNAYTRLNTWITG
jgi:hypothetical protein